MDRREFGKLISVLRKERYDLVAGRGWTQKQLADRTGLSERVIANIERGDKVILDGDILGRLATAFALNALERQEFVALAAGAALDDWGVAAPIAAVREQVLQVAAELRLPCFVCDDFYNVMAANRPALVLYDLAPDRLAQANSEVPNFLDLLLTADSPIRRTIRAGRFELAQHSVQRFRATSLRFRHTPQFHALFARLAQHADFLSQWVEASVEHSASSDALCIEVQKEGIAGRLKFAVTASTTISYSGNLHLVMLLPANQAGLDYAVDLPARASQIRHLALWPPAAMPG
jgi:transcriptional regulator with XRE-family HTH domain